MWKELRSQLRSARSDQAQVIAAQAKELSVVKEELKALKKQVAGGGGSAAANTINGDQIGVQIFPFHRVHLARAPER